jgi:hypothetical protein
VRAKTTFAWQGGTVVKGQRYRGNDPAVIENWNAFVPGETLDQELKNPFDALPPPPQHEAPVHVGGTPIPAWRQVRSVVDLMLPVRWSPGSPGAETQSPPPMVRSVLRQGQICDVLSDVVKENPSWFRWIERDVTAEDVAHQPTGIEGGDVTVAIVKPSAPKVAPSVKLQPNVVIHPRRRKRRSNRGMGCSGQRAIPYPALGRSGRNISTRIDPPAWP